MKKIKRNYVIIFILVLMAFVCFSASYAFLTNVNEQHGKLNIKVGDLKYKIESDKLDSGNITVPANTTQELTIKLTSLNEIDSKYELYYQIDSANDSVNVGYSPDTENPVLGSISANDSKNITIVIANKSSSSTKISFGVVGGLIKNDLVLSIGNSLNKEVSVSKIFADAILNDNNLITAAPTLTNSSNNTSDASGLYKSTDTNTGDATYYFRGAVENNYVSFAGFTWRIVRINEDGTIRIVMQDCINDNAYVVFNSNSNDYKYMYYTNSEAKTVLENWYQTNIGSKSDLINNVASGNYYCEQAKVKTLPESSSGNATMTTNESYIPNFKCEMDGNSKGIINASVGLLTYDEVIYAGNYYLQTNTNYYLYNGKYFWTMSPAGFSGVYSIVWDVTSVGALTTSFVYGSAALRPVLNLKADTLVTGTGTSANPYVIES